MSIRLGGKICAANMADGSLGLQYTHCTVGNKNKEHMVSKQEGCFRNVTKI